jgi:hypothetical protein
MSKSAQPTTELKRPEVMELPPPAEAKLIGRRGQDPQHMPPLGQPLHRYDDPLSEFATKYAADLYKTALLETMAPLRPSVKALVAAGLLTEEEGDELELKDLLSLPDSWAEARYKATIRLEADEPFLDVRRFETLAALSTEMPDKLDALGVDKLDAGTLKSSNYAVTQAIARWAYMNGFSGVAYTSRYDDHLACYAAFDKVALRLVGDIQPIRPDDPDFLEVRRRFFPYTT